MVQLSTDLRTDMAGRVEAVIGPSPTLELRTGAAPANCAAADTGTLLATLTLPSDWLAAAASGAVTINGTWTGTVSVDGTAAHFRIKASGVCKKQGTVSGSGGGGEMIVSPSATLVNGQPFTVTAYTFTIGGA